MLNMPGHPVKTKAEDEGDGLREFTFTTWGGRGRTIRAKVIQFHPHHVAFWTGDNNDFLLEAVKVLDVNGLREVAPGEELL